MVLAACNDSSEVRSAKGAYRFKTTGKVTLKENFQGATKADTLVANLESESGTLELVSLHDEDSVLLTIDPLNGNVTVTRGEIKGKRLNFTEYARTIEVPTTVTYYDTIKIDLGLITKDTIIARERNAYEPYDIRVSGHADVYDNNLVFHLEYTGKSQTSERTLRGKDITSLAKKN